MPVLQPDELVLGFDVQQLSHATSVGQRPDAKSAADGSARCISPANAVGAATSRAFAEESGCWPCAAAILRALRNRAFDRGLVLLELRDFGCELGGGAAKHAGRQRCSFIRVGAKNGDVVQRRCANCFGFIAAANSQCVGCHAAEKRGRLVAPPDVVPLQNRLVLGLCERHSGLPPHPLTTVK